MKLALSLSGLALGMAATASGGAAPPPSAVVLETRAAMLRIERTGGVLSEFRLAGDTINPLAGMGHFLCLDRWGPPSEAEAKNGMPFHGEAWKADWEVVGAPREERGGMAVEMAAELPLAGLTVHREVWLSNQAAVVQVRERVTNRNRRGRIYNIVQHPTIGAPFLDEETRVDAGAGRGFMQSSPLPNPEKPEVHWPDALHEGKRVDLRRLTDDPNPNVVSYVARGKLGWTTAVAPKQERLIGYLWKTSEYPWFNAWRHVENGKPALRGLEFGTTGLHQPFSVLTKKQRIFKQPLFVHLDAGESVTRSYVMFLTRTGPKFNGVESVKQGKKALRIQERNGKREISLPAPEL